MKGWRALGLTLAITAGLLALAAGLRTQYVRLLAEHRRRQLATVPDGGAAALLEQVAGLGEPGIAVLVEALGSQRQSVATAARRALGAEVDRWETLRARDSSPKLARLARALAEHVDRFGPAARADADDLAARILHWPLDNTVVDRLGVIASCQSVLQATTRDRRPLAEEEPAGEDGGQAPLGAIARHRGDLLPGLAELPRGGRPLETSRAGDASPGPAARPTARPGSSLDQPRRLLSVPEIVKPAPPFAGRPDGGESSDPPSPQTSALRQESSGAAGEWADSGGESSEWAGVETVDVMRRLQAEDESLAAAAEAELERRGFSTVHLELARQLFDPDPQVREALARLLPELRSVDAVPWLMRLCRDEDAGVRRVAIILMATTGDPTLLAEIEQIARRDPDPGIQQQAERIARQRQGIRY